MLFLIYLIFSTPYCVSYMSKQVCYEMQKLDNNLNVKITGTIKGWAALGIGTAMTGDVVMVWRTPNNDIGVSNRQAKGYGVTKYAANNNLLVTKKVLTNNTFEIQFNRPIAATLGFTQKAATHYMSALSLAPVNTTDPAYVFEKHDFAINFEYFVNTASNNTKNGATGFEFSAFKQFLILGTICLL
eukprot:NODE_345_length_9042_cov_0.258973.p5 type:complete len:186 gc:universal NODE_345_length_9042_cov_0.258973:3382-3939(+)